ncbi:MAG: hypothetical protein GYA12_00670 [Chloroflexi bacterium]|nr:hypothetical protein [Chloroflexota bacterium]
MKKDQYINFAWQAAAFIMGLLITWAFLNNPTPRQFGLAFRYDFLQIMAPLAVIVFLVLKLPYNISRFLLLGIISAILVLPIAGLWASGQSEQYILGGIIPFSDARFYFTDSHRLLEGSVFFTGAARRPLFTTLMSSIQWLTGQNLPLTIAVLTLILGYAMYFATYEFRTREGAIAGSVFLVLLYSYARLLLGKTLSEFAGLPLGLLALVFMLRGITRKQLKLMITGLFLLSLGLNARAGAFFILPVLALWTGWYFRKSGGLHWRSFILACLAVVLGFLINLVAFNTYSSPDSAPFGNFSFTIYGVARGGLGWTQVFTEHPETWEMPTGEQSRYIYSLTLDIIRRKPMNLVKGILSSYQTFFSLDDYYGSLCWFGDQGVTGTIARIGYYLLMLTGLFFCIKNIKNPVRSFYLTSFIGIVLSIPFAPPIDSNRMRVYAATIPFFISIPGIGLASLADHLPWEFFRPDKTEFPSLIPPKTLSAVLVIMMTVQPLIPFKSTHSETPPIFSCSTGLKPVSFRILPGNHIRIVDQDSIQQEWISIIREKTMANRIHNLPNWETYDLFSNVKPGQVILVDLDLQTKNPMILIAEWERISQKSGIQTLCGRPSTDIMLREYNVFFAEEYMPE